MCPDFFIASYVFLVATCCASFIQATEVRLARVFEKISSSDSDEQESEDVLVSKAIFERSHCESCGHVLRLYELIPIVSFILLKGRCSSCGRKYGFSHFFWELSAGAIGVFAYFFLLKGIFISNKEMFFLSFPFLALGVSFILLSAITDAKTGFVWDFSAGMSNTAVITFLALNARNDCIILLCIVGWIAYLLSMTGKAGQGDAAPLASSSGLICFVFPYAPQLSVISCFLIILSISGLLHAIIEKRLKNNLSITPSENKTNFLKHKIPLVPHIFFATMVMFFWSGITNGILTFFE